MAGIIPLLFFVFLILPVAVNGQIAQRGTATVSTTNTTSLTINKPSGIIAGDVMIVNINQAGNTSTDPTSSGWTLIDGGTSSGSPRYGSVLYKVADGTEGSSIIFTLGTGVTSAIGSIIAFSGVNTSGATPFDIIPGNINADIPTNNGANYFANAFSITTITNNAAVIFLAQSGADGTTNQFSNWSGNKPSLDEIMDFGTNGSPGQAVGAAWGILNTADDTKDRRVRLTGNFYCGGILIALKPFEPVCSASSTLPTEYESITNVTFAGINNSSPVVKTVGYSNYYSTVSPGVVNRGQDYAASVTEQFRLGRYGGYCKIYIDYNQNGTFDLPEEYVFGDSYFGNETMTGTISIPLTATLGLTRMRVVLEGEADNTEALPCGTFIWGEVEDYAVNIVSQCTNPTSGGTIATAQTICSGGDPVPFTSTGLPTGHTGTLEYKWQSSTTGSGSGFSDITPGATGLTYNVPAGLTQTTWYKRLSKVTCSSVWEAAGESNVLEVTVNPIPSTPTASSNSPVCHGSNIQLTTPAVSGATYSWTGPSGFSSNLREPVVVADYYSNQGTYSVTITVSGCTSAAGTTNVVIEPVSVGGWISYAAPICEGSPVTLTLNGNTGNVTRWERRLGTSGAWTPIAVTSTTLTDTPPSGGSWQYRAVVQSGVCAEAYSDPLTVTVNPTLSITLGANPVICQTTTTAALTYSATTGSPVDYNLTFTSGINSPQNGNLPSAPGSITINVPYNIAPGTYNGNLTVFTYTPSCTSVVYPVTVTVNTSSPALVAITGNSTVCAGTSVTYTATPTNGGSSPAYQWKVNGNNVGTNSATFTYTPVHGDIITCVLTSNSSCATGSPVTSNEITMTVNPIPVATLTGGATICDGQITPIQINFTGTGPWQVTTQRNGAEPVTVFDITDNPYTFDVSAPGTYTISAFQDAGCTGTFSGSAVVTVNPLPTITLSSTSGEVCLGDVITNLSYSATTGSPNKYSIYFDQDAIDEGFENVTNSGLNVGTIDIPVPENGTPDTYNAVLTVKNSTTGCSSVNYDITIIIHPLPDTTDITTN